MSYIAGCYESITNTFLDTHDTGDLMRSMLYDNFVRNICKTLNTDVEIQTSNWFFADAIEFARDLFIKGINFHFKLN